MSESPQNGCSFAFPGGGLLAEGARELRYYWRTFKTAQRGWPQRTAFGMRNGVRDWITSQTSSNTDFEYGGFHPSENHLISRPPRRLSGTNLFREGITTAGSVRSFITAFAEMIPLRFNR